MTVLAFSVAVLETLGVGVEVWSLNAGLLICFLRGRGEDVSMFCGGRRKILGL